MPVGMRLRPVQPSTPSGAPAKDHLARFVARPGSGNENPRDLLVQEGVQFEERGHATSQSITTEELAQIAGLPQTTIAETLPDPTGQDTAYVPGYRATAEYSPKHLHGVRASSTPGPNGRGAAVRDRGETSCFLWPALRHPSEASGCALCRPASSKSCSATRQPPSLDDANFAQSS